jgi:predicted DNA-binding transcriptional regulator AlpA
MAEVGSRRASDAAANTRRRDWAKCAREGKVMIRSKKRVDSPDYAERARRMPDLIASPALPIADVALFLDLPLSTIDKLCAQGRGPRRFTIGRRLYVRQSDLREWLDSMAVSDAS